MTHPLKLLPTIWTGSVVPYVSTCSLFMNPSSVIHSAATDSPPLSLYLSCSGVGPQDQTTGSWYCSAPFRASFGVHLISLEHKTIGRSQIFSQANFQELHYSLHPLRTSIIAVSKLRHSLFCQSADRSDGPSARSRARAREGTAAGVFPGR